jgi:steroid 5-alpha reductase family enzyme
LSELTIWWSIYLASLPAFLLPSSTVVTAATVSTTNIALRIGTASSAILSPCFITYLLLNISGIPIHERNHRKQYGDDNVEYQEYLQRTPRLVPTISHFLKWLTGTNNKKQQ